VAFKIGVVEGTANQVNNGREGLIKIQFLRLIQTARSTIEDELKDRIIRHAGNFFALDGHLSLLERSTYSASFSWTMDHDASPPNKQDFSPGRLDRLSLTDHNTS
jgi:hypothetical protein